MQKPLNLRKARLCAEVSQEAMASLIGVSRHTYARIEQNPDRATIAQAKAISNFLKVPLDKLFEVKN